MTLFVVAFLVIAALVLLLLMGIRKRVVLLKSACEPRKSSPDF